MGRWRLPPGIDSHLVRSQGRNTHTDTHIETQTHTGTHIYTQTHGHTQVTQFWPLRLLSQHSSQYDSSKTESGHITRLSNLSYLGVKTGAVTVTCRVPVRLAPAPSACVLCPGPSTQPRWPPCRFSDSHLLRPRAFARPILLEGSSLRHPHGSFRSQVSVSCFFLVVLSGNPGNSLRPFPVLFLSIALVT